MILEMYNLLLLRSIINIVISVIIMIMGRVLWLWCLVLCDLLWFIDFSVDFFHQMQFLNVFDPLGSSLVNENPTQNARKKNLETSSHLGWRHALESLLLNLDLYIYIYIYIIILCICIPTFFWNGILGGFCINKFHPWLSLWWKPTILTWHHPRLDLRPVMWRIRHKHRQPLNLRHVAPWLHRMGRHGQKTWGRNMGCRKKQDASRRRGFLYITIFHYYHYLFFFAI